MLMLVYCPALYCAGLCCAVQIAAMEVAVQTKRYELEQLLAENEQLKSRARVLETAERCSVEIHELMKLLDGLQVGWGYSQTAAGSPCILPACLHPDTHHLAGLQGWWG